MNAGYTQHELDRPNQDFLPGSIVVSQDEAGNDGLSREVLDSFPGEKKRGVRF